MFQSSYSSISNKIDTKSILHESRSQLSQRKMSNFTEMFIQTNDTDVPIIAIYKPDIRKQQRRVQCATIIERNLKKFELFRLHFAFNKINHLKVNEMRITHNVHLFQQLFTKLQNKRTSHAFLHLAASKMKKKCINSAAKILAYFQAKARTNNIKYCMNRLKINNYQSIISTLTNENQLSLQLKQAKDQLFKLKMGLFDQQFVEKSKPFVKFTDHDTFIDSIREMGYSSTVKGETARFELQRSKTNPKKKDSFDNQLIASVLANAIRAYDNLNSLQKQHSLSEIKIKQLQQPKKQFEQVLKFPAQMDESVIAKEYVKKWMTQMRYGLFCEQLADDQLQYLLKRLKTCNAAGGLDYYTKKWLQIKGIRIHNILYNRHEEAPDTTHSQHENIIIKKKYKRTFSKCRNLFKNIFKRKY